MNDKSLRTYLLFAFGLAWPVQGLAAWVYGQGNVTAYSLLLTLSMFAPLLAALFARIPLRDMGWKPAFKGKWRWVFAAWFGPAVLTALGAALYFLFFPAAFGGADALRAALGEEALSQLAEKGVSPETYAALNYGGALLYAPLINVIPSLGEEVGWRGTLYPRLKARFGTVRGRVLGGAIWGAWHWPIMLLAGYEYGTVYFGAPVTGLLLFCLICVGLGTLIDLVYEKTGCIWIPALAHGAFNATAATPLLLTTAEGVRPLLGPLPNALIGGLPLLLLAAFVLLRGAREKR